VIALRACPNVVFAKDHHQRDQDLALIRHASTSAPPPPRGHAHLRAAYHIVHCDMAPHLAAYRGSLVRSGPAELRYSFARELQTFGTEPETAESLAAEFGRIWSSRDWLQDEPARRAAATAPGPERT
jgi:hypothetical protein